jgi:DNA replication and repair protein RecF
VFSGPDDLHVVEGDPHERRRFMDEAVRSLWPLKEGLAPAYERVLRQRNRLLKDWEGPEDAAGLAAWDDQLVKHGVELGVARHQAVQAIEGRAAGEFHDLAGENLQVEYRPSVWGDSPEAAFRERLAARREDELIRRSTLVGPHRDDLALAVHDLAARGFASHGEAWGAAVCLRLALGGAVGAEWGEDPLTILDDPFSGLDPDRRFRLAARVGGRGQMLMAVPDESHVPPGATVWSVKDGAVAAA